MYHDTRLQRLLLGVWLTLSAAIAAGSCTDDGPTGPCVGPDPDASTAPVPAADASSDAAAPCPLCVGSPLPSVAMTDVQPNSCRAGQAYALEAFRGKTTIVALLASW